MFALLFIAVASANNYYLIKSRFLDVKDFVYVAEYGKCVAVYDALCVTDLCNQSEPLFYVNRYKNSNPGYYRDRDCKEFTHPTIAPYVAAIFNDEITNDVDQTYLNNKYEVKIKYNCNKSNNTIDIYARIGSVTIGNSTVGVTRIHKSYQQLYYKIQLTNKQIEGPAYQCIPSGYRFEEVIASTTPQNPSSSQNPPNTNTNFDEACKRLIPNSHYDSTSQTVYPCVCDTGYDRVNNQNNVTTPFECVKNEWFAKNATCKNNHGQFAYFNKNINECDCENNYVLYDNQFCKEGNNYCKLMYPTENVYYDERSKNCECKDKEKLSAPGGKIICYSTYEEVCQKIYGNAHFDKNGEYDCSCNKGYKWEYKTEDGEKYPHKCVKIDDDSTTNIFIVLLMALILALF